jgi:hypothetical protein
MEDQLLNITNKLHAIKHLTQKKLEDQKYLGIQD